LREAQSRTLTMTLLAPLIAGNLAIASTVALVAFAID
jgi:hypothetical protein